MYDAGIGISDTIIPNGQLHRYRVDGDKPGTWNGWYILHIDHPPSGQFGSWRAGISKRWCALSRDRLTPAERETIKRRIDTNSHNRQEEIKRKQYAAQVMAEKIWNMACAATDDHPYLMRKQVRSHGLRIVPAWTKRCRTEEGIWRDLIIENVLLVPMVDWLGTLHNLQGIFPGKVDALGRDKDFLSGGRKKGLFYPLGHIDVTGTLILAEGFATGATIHEATGFPVLVCFDCGNLKEVAIEARRQMPGIDLVIAADNDSGTPGNPGLTKARESAVAARARLAIPSFAQEQEVTA